MNAASPFRALVADDTKEIRKLLVRALTRLGFKCDEARDGVMAANMAEIYTYDVVISDLRMPRAHGHQFLVDLLDHDYPAMLVAMTGLSEPGLFSDLIGRGVEDVIHKPFDYDIRASKVNALLLRRQQGARGNAAHPELSTESIETTSAVLKEQLAAITAQFQSTIDQLERQREQAETTHVESIRLLAGLIEGIPRSGGSHVGRVEDLATAVAESAGVAKADLVTLRAACLLHETGLIGMPDTLRGKAPWALSPDEKRIHERYPLLSATIVSGISGAEGCAQMIEHHAENFDGSGFPQGLKGDAISLGARIMRIADGVDTFKLYSNARTDQNSLLAHLKKESGQAYDPRLVVLMSEHLRTAAPEAGHTAERAIMKEDLRAGMRLADNVYNDDGQFLMRQHTHLDDVSAARLIRVLPEGAVVRVCES